MKKNNATIQTSIVQREKIVLKFDIVLSLFVSITFLGLLIWGAITSIGVIFLLVCCYVLVYNIHKNIKNIIMNKNLNKLQSSLDKESLDWFIYLRWKKQIIGNWYVLFINLIIVLEFWFIFNLTFWFTDFPFRNDGTYLFTTILFLVLFLWIYLFWAFSFVFSKKNIELEKNNFLINKKSEIEINLVTKQTRKDYREIFDWTIGILTIFWGIYLILKKLKKNLH